MLIQDKKNQQNSTKPTSSFKPSNKTDEGDKNKKRWVKKSKSQNASQPRQSEFEEKVVKINRVTKVTKGGRRFRFSALVVVGNNKGKVGFATGKANEVPDAIKKAIKAAKKNLFNIPIVNTTIPHAALGRYGGGKVLIKPAKKGTGIIAGGPVRTLFEVSGVQDIYSKSLGSNTSINMIRAVVDGLKQLRTAEQIFNLRKPLVKTNEIPLVKEQT